MARRVRSRMQNSDGSRGNESLRCAHLVHQLLGHGAMAPAHRRESGDDLLPWNDRSVMNPRPLLHLEGAAVLAVSVFAYHSDHGSWGLFALLFLMPDVSMVG